MTKDAPRALNDSGLAGQTGITHGFFTRIGGVSEGIYASLNCGVGSGDSRDAILANRERVVGALGLADAPLVSPYQVHGKTVAIVREPWLPGEGPEADAVVTKQRGIAVGIGTADCAPVLFADAKAGIIGAAHAGWGGAIKGVLEATVAAMVGLGAEPARMIAAIGPAIAQQSYQVGADFHARFHADDPTNDRFFVPSDKPGHHQFDLPGYVASRLQRIGLAEIGASGLDTYADETRFFSFRRSTHRGEADYGRMVSAIALI